MKRILPLLSLAALSLMAVPALLAQRTTGLTGALAGTITDTRGRPLAGVEVRCTSKQVARTLRTGGDGRFRANMLNPGHWRLEVSKPGFKTERETVMLYMNRVTTANYKLADGK